MRRALCTVSLLAFIAAVAAAQAKKPDAAAQAGKCTGTIEKKPWCEKCMKILAKTDVKDGKCTKDETKVELVDVCVKKTYSFSCHPNKEGAGPGKS